MPIDSLRCIVGVSCSECGEQDVVDVDVGRSSPTWDAVKALWATVDAKLRKRGWHAGFSLLCPKCEARISKETDVDKLLQDRGHG